MKKKPKYNIGDSVVSTVDMNKELEVLHVYDKGKFYAYHVIDRNDNERVIHESMLL